MSLKITIKPDERVIIGGAVITNGNNQGCSLIIENKVPVLRRKDILKEDRANTLCKRIYFVIQLMYVDDKNLVEYHKMYWELVKNVVHNVPETIKYIDNISEKILGGDYYQALKFAKKLINYEAEVLNCEQKSLKRI